MKNLFLLLFLGSITDLYAQNIYVPGEIIKGQTAVYHCELYTNFMLRISDVNDVSTIRSDSFDILLGNNEEVLQEILREELTDEEWYCIKGKAGYGLTSTFVLDAQGKKCDWVFMFRTDDPVLTKFEPDRLYKLEQKFKNAFPPILDEYGKCRKNLIYIQHLKYMDF